MERCPTVVSGRAMLTVYSVVRQADNSRCKAPRGLPPDKRVESRQAGAKPAFDGLEAWLNTQPHDISGKSPLAAAIRYALTRMARLSV